MLQTLALAAALSLAPAQNGQLALTNDRITFGGEFGPSRPSNKHLPGDIFHLAFDIENLTISPEGTVKYSIGMMVSDASGKEVMDPATGKPMYSAAATDQEVTLPLGGTKLPARAFVIIRPEQPPGMFNCRVTVTDRVTNASKIIDKQFEVLPAQFGTVGLTVAYDANGELAAPLVAAAGQALWLHFAVVGFSRDPQTRQPNVTAELRVLENGQPTNQRPNVYGLDPKTKIEENVPGVFFHIPVPMNRAGSFTVELKTQCKVSGKDYKMTFPITVLQAQK